MKKLLLILLVGMFLIGLASGLDDLGSYTQGECVQLRQTCATCSYVNVSVIFPNSSKDLTNGAMISQGAGLWTYNYCNTTLTGRYDVVGKGDVGGVATSFASYFLITPLYHITERDVSETSIFLIVAIAVSLVVYFSVTKLIGAMGIFLSGFGVLFEVPQNGWIGWIIISCGFIMLIYCLIGNPSRKRNIRRR